MRSVPNIKNAEKAHQNNSHQNNPINHWNVDSEGSGKCDRLSPSESGQNEGLSPSESDRDPVSENTVEVMLTTMKLTRED